MTLSMLLKIWITSLHDIFKVLCGSHRVANLMLQQFCQPIVNILHADGRLLSLVIHTSTAATRTQEVLLTLAATACNAQCRQKLPQLIMCGGNEGQSMPLVH
eukprot:scaffold3772_cov29-Prasinocladus_malaysianus.AAC.1